ncbi:MAG: hypothetical protein ACE15D_02190 [Candidatus Eisenbacteria bacterium]|nr:hypothetical protein [Candidatus Eisenbacteria bacterium]
MRTGTVFSRLPAVFLMGAACAIFSSTGIAQPERTDPAPAGTPPASAAMIFEKALLDEGIDAAIERLRGILADTTGAYEIDMYQLAREIPARLKQQGRKGDSLALIELLANVYADSPPLAAELATAYLAVAREEQARAAFARAAQMNPERSDLAWMRDHLDALLATVRIQLAMEGKHSPGASTGLQGPYLGQRPPATRPEVFAPGIVSTTDHEYSITFAPDGREIYFSRSLVGTLVCRWNEDGWTAPEPVRLLEDPYLTEEASVAPNGRTIFFCGRKGMREERTIYAAPRAGDRWGAAERLFTGMYATATRDGVLYYTEITGRPDYGVIVRRTPAGQGAPGSEGRDTTISEASYGEPEVIPGDVNSEAPDAHPFITPDESLLLFDTYRNPGAGLYVCFRKPDGSWGSIVRLDDKLGIPPVGQAALSPDGRYLFFCLAGDMYWVDAGFLDGLRRQ